MALRGCEVGQELEKKEDWGGEAGLAVPLQWKTARAAARRMRVRHQEGIARVPEALWASLLKSQVASILCLMEVGEDGIDQISSMRDPNEHQGGLGYELMPLRV